MYELRINYLSLILSLERRGNRTIPSLFSLSFQRRGQGEVHYS